MSSKGIGVGISLDGEREYRQSISNINQDMRVLKSEMKMVTAEFGDNKDSVQALTAKNKVLNDEIETQKRKVDTLNDALEDAKKNYGDDSDEAAKWQISLNNAKADLSKLNNELNENENKLKQAENATDNFNDELKDTTNASKDASGGIGNFGTILAGSLSAQGIMTAITGIINGVKEIGEAAIEAAEKFKELADETSEYGDEIDKNSQKLGLSREAYQRWSYIIGQSGGDITSMEAGFKTFTNTIDDAKNGVESAVEKFEKLGISIDDINSKNYDELFEKTITGFQLMDDQVSKAADANDLFGRSAVDLMPTLNTTVYATKELYDRVDDLGILMSDEAVDSAVTYGDRMDDLSLSMEGLRNSIMTYALPGMSELADGSAMFFGEMSSEIEAADGDWAKIGTIISGHLLEGMQEIEKNLPQFLDEGTELIAALCDGINSNDKELLNAFTEICTTLGTAVGQNTPALAEIGMKTMVAISQGIFMAMGPAMEQGWEATKANMSKVVDKGIPYLNSIGKNIMEGIINGITSSGSKLGNALVGQGKNALNQLKKALGIHSPSTVFKDEVGINLGLGVGEGFKDAMSSVNRQMAKAVDTSQYDLSARMVSNVTATTSNPVNNDKITKIEIPIYLDAKKIAAAVYEGQLKQDYQYNAVAQFV